MVIKELYLRVVIHAAEMSAAVKIHKALLKSLGKWVNKNTELVPYEEDHYFESKLYGNISGTNEGDIRSQVLEIQSMIGEFPWYMEKAVTGNGPEQFEIEGYFNPESFLHRDPDYNNRVNWVHLIVDHLQ
jgi:hypothetical protein